MAVIRSVGRIQIGHWNSIFIQRQLRQGYVRLNSENTVEGKIDVSTQFLHISYFTIQIQ